MIPAVETTLTIVRRWLPLCRALMRRSRAGPEEIQLARELRSLREAIVRAIGPSTSCAGCGWGHPTPHGRWDGGFCCGGFTEELFGEHELAALRLSGTRPWHLIPRGPSPGCIFRGPRGCGLAPRHRPSICVGYLCLELQRELMARGALDHVERLCGALRGSFETFVDLRRRRLDKEWAKEL